MKNKSLVSLATLAVAFGVSSCYDYDGGLTEKQIEYAENFKEVFGEIDPKQDWNMAQQITATIDMPEITEQVNVKIYENNPLATVNAKYLTDIDIIGGRATWKFDAPKGDNELYVKICKNNEVIVKGFTTIENNSISITQAALTSQRKPKMTRAASDITKGEEAWKEVLWDETEENGAIIIKNSSAALRVRQIKIIDNKLYYTPDITTTAFRPLAYNNSTNDGYNFDIYGQDNLSYEDGSKEQALNDTHFLYFVEYAGSTLKYKSDVVKSKKPHISHTYKISGDTKVDDVTWLIGDCKDLFWTEGKAPFKESEDYRSDRKKAIYSSCDATLSDMEAGVLYTTSKKDAEINIPMMYGATQRSNILGYYYYTEDQDPRDVNRYILYEDARPTTNIKIDGDAVPDGMTLQSYPSGANDNSVVSCTTRALMYFGPNGDWANGTTKFPENVKIGFFIRRLPEKVGDNFKSITPAEPGGETGFAYSTPEMNKYHFYAATGAAEQNGFWDYRGSRDASVSANTARGNVKAITWDYNGRILVGFGDDTGDCDLNDFVFWVNGDIKEKPKVKVDTRTREDVYEWVVACEDLGKMENVSDIDFNDVVFGIKHYKKATNMYEYFYDADGTLITTVPTVVDKQNYLVVTPYAAGGTLKSTINYKKGQTGAREIGEIHSLLDNANKNTYAGLSSGEMPMLNTRSLSLKGNPTVIELEGSEDFTATDISDFSITVEADGARRGEDAEAETITAPKAGDAPQMIVVPCGWDWPTERTSIEDAYPRFTKWTSDATLLEWSEVKSGSTITNPYKTASTSGGDDSGDDGDDNGNTDVLPEHSFTLRIGSTNVTDAEYEVVVGTKIDDLGLPSENGFTVTSRNTDVAEVSMGNAGNAYNHSITTKTTGTAVISVTKAADQTHKLTTHTVTLKVVEQSQEPEPGGDETPDLSQYGTEVSLNSNNEISLEDLRNITETGPISVTVVGHVNQWASGNTKLSWNKDQGYGYQVVDVDGTYQQAAQTTVSGGETIVLTMTMSGEDYDNLINSKGYEGGLIVCANNFTSYKVCVKQASVSARKRATTKR